MYERLDKKNCQNVRKRTQKIEEKDYKTEKRLKQICKRLNEEIERMRYRQREAKRKKGRNWERKRSIQRWVVENVGHRKTRNSKLCEEKEIERKTWNEKDGHDMRMKESK